MSTRYYQPVTHASTNRARRCLTAQIGRDGVCSAWCGPSPSRPRESSTKSRKKKSSQRFKATRNSAAWGFRDSCRKQRARVCDTSESENTHARSTGWDERKSAATPRRHRLRKGGRDRRVPGGSREVGARAEERHRRIAGRSE